MRAHRHLAVNVHPFDAAARFRVKYGDGGLFGGAGHHPGAALSHLRGGRRGRHGIRVSRPRSGTRRDRRAEDPARPRLGVANPLSARGAGAQGAAPSRHRALRRPRPAARRRALSGDGVARRRGSVAAPKKAAAEPARDRRAGPGRGQRARGGARKRHHPPRHQAGQSVSGRRRSAAHKAPRLRHRAAVRRWVGDAHRHHRRHAGLHGAGAGAQRARHRSSRRSVRFGLRAVRVSGRAPAFRFRADHGRVREDPVRTAARSRRAAPERAAGAGRAGERAFSQKRRRAAGARRADHRSAGRHRAAASARRERAEFDAR